MSGCVPEQLEPERGPATLKNETLKPGRSGWPQEVKVLKDLRTRTKGREALVTGMDLVGVAKELLALAVSSKVRSSICGRQAKAAFWAACRRFFGT